ncbi:hypothetical protein BGZ76_010046 [Entomortierella beljakovae]|nr:hypothetical protein BGZ76_010046 [Entomortierella beljakovae]
MNKKAALGLMKDQRNYFRINSTLNTITPKSLEASKSIAFERGIIPKSFFNQSKRGNSTSPIVTILIGGPNEDCFHNTERIINRLTRLVDVQGCRVLVSFSQRTADSTRKAIKELQQRIQDDTKFFVYDPMTTTNADQISKDENHLDKPTVNWSGVPGPKGLTGFLPDQDPYEAMLALADKIVVTADSIVMTNEALATGKPVYVLGGELARGKLKVFHRYLADLNLTRAFRPGRFLVTPMPCQHQDKNGSLSADDQAKDTADPLSYPGDHPPWSNAGSGLVGTGPEQVKKLAERLRILRECRLAGRRPPEHIVNATH